MRLLEDVVSCSICMDEYKNEDVISILNCNHKFHKKCVDKWLYRNLSCPICRQNIMIEESIENT